MANIINLNAEAGANYIGDDARASVTFSNSSTGPGLEVRGLVATSTASIDVADISSSVAAPAATFTGSTTTSTPLTLTRSVIGSATTAALNIGVASTASAPAIQLTGTAFVSVTTIQFTTGGVANTGALRVRLTDNDTLGWIPIMPDAAVTAATWE